MRFSIMALGLCLLAAPALAADTLPDPGHIAFTPADKIPWKCNDQSGQCSASLFGDSSKPGIYGVLIKWMPNHFSRPHFHTTDRYIYVVSGTWWVSSSETFDPANTYPMRAGSFVTDIANTVHWDGAKDEPAVLELVGTGPMTTTQIAPAK